MAHPFVSMVGIAPTAKRVGVPKSARIVGSASIARNAADQASVSTTEPVRYATNVGDLAFACTLGSAPNALTVTRQDT